MPIGVYPHRPRTSKQKQHQKIKMQEWHKTQKINSIPCEKELLRRKRISDTLEGHEVKQISREKISKKNMGKMCGNENPAKRLEVRKKIGAALFTGGKKYSDRRTHFKRRNLGRVFLNNSFKECEAHHIDRRNVLHIPIYIHKNFKHNHNKSKTMIKINIAAWIWYLFDPEGNKTWFKESSQIYAVQQSPIPSYC